MITMASMMQKISTHIYLTLHYHNENLIYVCTIKIHVTSDHNKKRIIYTYYWSGIMHIALTQLCFGA